MQKEMPQGINMWEEQVLFKIKREKPVGKETESFMIKLLDGREKVPALAPGHETKQTIRVRWD